MSSQRIWGAWPLSAVKLCLLSLLPTALPLLWPVLLCCALTGSCGWLICTVRRVTFQLNTVAGRHIDMNARKSGLLQGHLRHQGKQLSGVMNCQRGSYRRLQIESMVLKQAGSASWFPGWYTWIPALMSKALHVQSRARVTLL